MAEIYLAAPGEGTSTQRVAIKVIHPQNATDPDFVRMLIDEAKLAVQLTHPNIAQIFDAILHGVASWVRRLILRISAPRNWMARQTSLG